MSWIKRVKKNIVPVSQENISVRKALDEWFYTGHINDVRKPIEICELCDHPNIRYQFEIKNRYNGNTLFIGSECILKFDISVIDEDGNELSNDQAQKKLSKDRRKVIEKSKLHSVINSLLILAKRNDFFKENMDSFIEYYKERGAFTPKQLITLINGIDRYNIKVNKNHFKMIIRRTREKEQLINMKKNEIKKILPCLSPYQEKFYLRESKK